MSIEKSALPRAIIGLTGFKGSGKSEVARFLVEQYKFERLPFAGPLKAMLAAAGMKESELFGGDKEKPSALFGGQTPRYVMQRLGTEWGRDMIHPDLWVLLWEEAIKHAGPRIVVEDVRHENEHQAIFRVADAICAIWYVGGRPGVAAEAGAHRSEQLADRMIAHQIITNDKTLKALEAQVKDRAFRHLDKNRLLFNDQ